MTRLISIHEASHQTGLSVTTLRRGVASGRFPATRAGANHSLGKIMFDPELLAQVLRNEVLSNIRINENWKAESSTLDKSFALEDTKITMSNVSKLFGKINKTDVDSGRFAPDKFYGTVEDDDITSDTISFGNSANK